jgi:hypothetical protein
VRRVARIGDQSRKSLGKCSPPFGKADQHNTVVGGKPAAIECGCDFLAGDGW